MRLIPHRIMPSAAFQTKQSPQLSVECLVSPKNNNINNTKEKHNIDFQQHETNYAHCVQ